MSDPILILGAGGFVGQQITRELARNGERVIAVSRRPLAVDLANVEVIIGEPHEPGDFLPLVKRSRAVIHAASRSTPGSSAGNPFAELHTNLATTLALIQALQEFPRTELLYLSSGGSLYAPALDELATEVSPVRPRSYHGAGKIAAEHFISACCSQYASAATILRPSNIYGPGQTERTGFGIIPTAFGKIIRKETLSVWGDGSTTRDYLYIEDFVSLCIATLTSPMPAGARVFNASSGEGTSLNRLFGLVEEAAGSALVRKYEADRTVDAPRVVMDASLARQQYGWTARTPLREGLRNTWEWFNTI